MQVVDMFINEATMFTVYQSYVEANFINDMMNLRDVIVTLAVTKGLKIVIGEVTMELAITE